MREEIVYRSASHNPYFNIALEHWLFNSYDSSKDILYLWCNAPSVIIGRFQNPWTECRLSLMQEKNIHLVRRESGGGAVFHDLGNGIFSFFSPFADEESEKRNYERLIKALHLLGIDSAQSSRNDLTILEKGEVRKVSGNAFKRKGNVNLQHGTMLINTNLDELGDYLSPHPKKLASKGISSVRSRVINLTDLSPSLTVEEFHKALEQVFWEEDPSQTPQTLWLNEDFLEQDPLLKEEFEKLQDTNWILGKTPQFNHTLEEVFPLVGSWTIHLEVEKGQITQVKIFTDCLSVPFVELLATSLKGVYYSSSGIEEAFTKIESQVDDFSRPWIPILKDWIKDSIR